MKIVKVFQPCLKKEIYKLAKCVRKGCCGVIPTDTLYGIVASVYHKKSVNKVYRLKSRNKSKPCIVLISKIDDLNKKFGIRLNEKSLRKFLKNIWPGKVSVVFNTFNNKFSYLLGGGNTLALRVPEYYWLRNFLRYSGPIIAPSANVEGKKPASNLEEAISYFGVKVDFYIDGGEVLSLYPSTLIYLDLNTKEIKLLRKGAVPFSYIKEIHSKCFKTT